MRFVASKSRVSPLRELTIPRLELLSALLLARLMDSITHCLANELELSSPICCTDSRVAHYWIIGHGKEWKQFVQNQVKEIRRLVPAECWRHCPGKDNPADLPSRGLPLLELLQNRLWREGPDWLAKARHIGSDSGDAMPTECATEMKSSSKQPTPILLTTAEETGVSQIIDCSNYSSITKLLRVTACVFKFLYILRQRIRRDNPPLSPEIQPEDIDSALLFWIKESQRCLLNDQRFKSWSQQFFLFTDDKGVLRCGGRLSNATLPYATRHPVLLSRDHYLTSLLVRQAHQQVMHNGVKETLTELRTRYWLIKGRSLVRKIIHKCVICRRFEGKQCLAPPPPPLPQFRVKEEPPFTHTGVDFAGPIFIKRSGSVGSDKVWLCLYTCCVVHAVHLDIVPDMTTAAFLRSFKRFSARRGFPRKIISDNGKTFKAAAKLIKALVTHKDVQEHLANIGTKWCFNIEKAPWWGGMFERLIRSAKRCLKKMIGRARLTFDELLTMVTEVEAILNSRPLSYLSSDDMDEVITPSHFLTGRRVLSIPDGLHAKKGEEEDPEVTSKDLTRRMNHLNGLLNHFWKRWKVEYLLELRDCHRYNTGHPDAKPVSVGDIVLVHDEQPRGFWRLAKVIETVPGHDGQIRGAILRVAGTTRPSTLRRPLQLLYPLEVKERQADSGEFPTATEPEVSDQHKSSDDPAEVDEHPSLRPTRASAVRARARVREWIEEGSVIDQ